MPGGLFFQSKYSTANNVTSFLECRQGILSQSLLSPPPPPQTARTLWLCGDTSLCSMLLWSLSTASTLDHDCRTPTRSWCLTMPWLLMRSIASTGNTHTCTPVQPLLRLVFRYQTHLICIRNRSGRYKSRLVVITPNKLWLALLEPSNQIIIIKL